MTTLSVVPTRIFAGILKVLALLSTSQDYRKTALIFTQYACFNIYTQSRTQRISNSRSYNRDSHEPSRLLSPCPWHHTIPSVTHLTDISHSQHTSTTSNYNSKPHHTNAEHRNLGNLDVYGPSCYLSDTDSMCQREKKVEDDKLAAATALDTTLAIIDLPSNESMYSYILSSRTNIIAFDNNGHRVGMIDIPLPVETD